MVTQAMHAPTTFPIWQAIRAGRAAKLNGESTAGHNLLQKLPDSDILSKTLFVATDTESFNLISRFHPGDGQQLHIYLERYM